MKELIGKIIKEFEVDLEDAIGVKQHTVTYQITEAIIKEIALKYAKEMCELQKQECLNDAEAKARWCGDTEVDEKSILNCKNVCES